jgi:hypothetical protein
VLRALAFTHARRRGHRASTCRAPGLGIQAVKPADSVRYMTVTSAESITQRLSAIREQLKLLADYL